MLTIGMIAWKPEVDKRTSQSDFPKNEFSLTN